MQSTTLAVMCVFMTMGMALAMYGGGSYGYSSYVPYVPKGGSGFGDNGICKMYFLHVLCLSVWKCIFKIILFKMKYSLNYFVINIAIFK